jgi:hypothetical protein
MIPDQWQKDIDEFRNYLVEDWEYPPEEYEHDQNPEEIIFYEDWLEEIHFRSYNAPINLLINNMKFLSYHGALEKIVLEVHSGRKKYWDDVDHYILRDIINFCDQGRMRAAGDPLPEQEIYTLYRGVNGYGDERRVVDGISWTDSPNIASWFANKNFLYSRRTELHDPAVFQVNVQKEDILAYYNGRKESEYILKVPVKATITRLEKMPEPKLQRTT